jgi:Flp pilus assembly protein TadG
MILSRGGRKGAIAPLTAILMIPLVAMLAFAVDMGYITHTHNELQAAADAAALAGANQLIDNYTAYHVAGTSPSAKETLLKAAGDSARAKAKAYAGDNSAADAASLTLLDSDIELGFTDANGQYTALPAYSGYPNTLKVTLRRDASANGPLPMFFARALGVNTVDLTATATASIYAGRIDGFRGTTPVRSRILPVAYDVNDWNDFLKGTYQPWMTVEKDSAGLPRLSVYTSVKDRGNFGQLSLDQSNDGASTIKGWIHDGVTGEELQGGYTKGLLPLSSHNPNSLPDWKGNPGVKDTTIQAIGDHVNDLYLLPLYKPFSTGQGSSSSSNNGNGNGKGNGSGSDYQAGQGQGSNYYYTIVQFVGVKISAVDHTGNPKVVKVQASSLIDPNALYTDLLPVQPPSGSSPVVTTFTGAKLIR